MYETILMRGSFNHAAIHRRYLFFNICVLVWLDILTKTKVQEIKSVIIVSLASNSKSNWVESSKQNSLIRQLLKSVQKLQENHDFVLNCEHASFTQKFYVGLNILHDSELNIVAP